MNELVGPGPLWLPRSSLAARLLGLGFALAGWAILCWQVLGTFRRMEAGEPQVEYSITLILFGELFVVLGGVWLVGGLAGYEAVRRWQTRPKARIILMAASLVLAAVTWWLMKEQFAHFGYQSR